ncbi:MAG TPA: winged helix DNA-binding domain-containing protein [Chloroflexota bacterium]|nr:winged helix DNA-binding domain-containing protein [Chloroflexota bacterium]
MTLTDLAARRLRNQRLTGPPFASAMDALAWFGAVQSQEYASAKWALGQRTRDATEADLDRLFDAGAILRTHVMRPTWHFVAPDDVRWMLELTSPRLTASLAGWDRQLEVDATLVTRSYTVIEAALGGGSHLTRSQLATRLAQAGIAAVGPRLANLVMHAELDGLVISGPRHGKQFTYALLEERVPRARQRDRDEALAELTLRYFTSHGPAQVQDFVWWSGLTTADVKRGLALAAPYLTQEVIGENSYWSFADVPEGSARYSPRADESAPSVHLLPNYDEFMVAYRDRAASLDPSRGLDTTLLSRGSVLSQVVLVNGQVRGGWKRQIVGSEVVVELALLDVLDTAADAGLQVAARNLARFLGVQLCVSTV